MDGKGAGGGTLSRYASIEFQMSHLGSDLRSSFASQGTSRVCAREAKGNARTDFRRKFVVLRIQST